MALSGTRFQRAGLCCTARRNHITKPVAPSITRLWHLRVSFFGATWRREFTGGRGEPRTTEALKDNIRLNITHTEKDILRRKVENMQRWVRMCLAVGSGHFEHLMWSHPVRHEFTYVSSQFNFVSFTRFAIFRLQRPGRYVWIFLTFLHLCWWRFSLLRCNTLPPMVSFDNSDESTASTFRVKQSKKIDSA